MHDGLSERGLGSQDGHLGVVGLRGPGEKHLAMGGPFLWQFWVRQFNWAADRMVKKTSIHWSYFFFLVLK